ncbi:hypothetical protein GSI_03273 [Ganoderma sinense ZZ0214-1]|uniref:Uncharacterized protein n=1 Tax=Ganoderma sinense ZZ0214-1 TaxID=1077348 RepID=A0A2G8SL46_9APHY|nr:hypothetical protein GSI_03273 [Ganoderma sinense ZZ0214-1]
MTDWNTIFQNCWYIGNNFNAILYGVAVMFYLMSARLILNGRRAKPRRNSDKWLLFLNTGLIVMITIYLIAQNFFGQEMWVINEGYPGGSGQYYADHAAVWYQTLGSASSVVLCLMSDAFLIYRTYVVWTDWRVVIFPSILYCGAAALGIMTCYFSGRSNADFFVGVAPHVALSYSTVVITTNVLCTTLICGRILWIRRKMQTVGVGSAAARAFTTAVSIVVESMLPYTLFGVAYVATLGANSPVAILFLSLYVMFTMIILWMLMGRGWSQETTTMWTRSLDNSPTETKAPFTLSDGSLTDDPVTKEGSTGTAFAV